MFNVESGVSVEASSARKSYPFREMKVGDSFYVDGRDDYGRARRAAGVMQGRTDMRFMGRSESSGGRIWRVA